MADYTINLAPEYGTTATIRFAAGGGKYVTLTVKTGDTISTKDPETAKAIESLGARVVSTLATAPTKVTYDADTQTKAALPQESTK
jgi:hypothetical protein